jgi:hypothetical protein
MQYYLFFAEYISKSPYSYFILVADESLIQFGVWSKRKSFNSTLYTEAQILDLIDEKYPNSIRVERPPQRKKIEV